MALVLGIKVKSIKHPKKISNIIAIKRNIDQIQYVQVENRIAKIFHYKNYKRIIHKFKNHEVKINRQYSGTPDSLS